MILDFLPAFPGFPVFWETLENHASLSFSFLLAPEFLDFLKKAGYSGFPGKNLSSFPSFLSFEEAL